MVVEMVSGERVEVPEGKILVAWANPDYEAEAPYEVFEQDVPEKGICAYGVYETPVEFLMAWREMVHNPEGMWYWVMDGGDCICSGACDPGDIEIFEENFGWKGFFQLGIPSASKNFPQKHLGAWYSIATLKHWVNFSSILTKIC